jgi:GH15 family glucan-1,4-alpha-glucosidase
MTSTPIADYGLLSDCRSAALVSAAGSVDWLCLPRFDSPSVFGRLLGDAAGYWAIRPVTDFTSTRRYIGPSMVLETSFRTHEGEVTVTDALVLGDGNRGHDLGAGSPGALVRQVSCTRGRVELDIVFVARPEYGLIRPLVRADQADC